MMRWLLQPVPAQRGGEVGRGLYVAVVGEVYEVAGESGEVGHHVRAFDQRDLRMARGEAANDRVGFQIAAGLDVGLFRHGRRADGRAHAQGRGFLRYG